MFWLRLVILLACLEQFFVHTFLSFHVSIVNISSFYMLLSFFFFISPKKLKKKELANLTKKFPIQQI